VQLSTVNVGFNQATHPLTTCVRSEYANQEFIVKFGTLYSEKLDADILLFFSGI